MESSASGGLDGHLVHEVDVTWDDVRTRFKRDLKRDGSLLPVDYGWKLDLYGLAMCVGGFLLILVLFPTREALIISSVAFSGIFLVWFALLHLSPQSMDDQWVKFTRKAEAQRLVGHFTYTLDDRGIQLRDETSSWLVAWWQTPAVEEFEDALYVRLDGRRSAIIPAVSFPDSRAFRLFAARTRLLWETGQATPRAIDDGIHLPDEVTAEVSAEDLVALRSKRAFPKITFGTLFWLAPAALLAASSWPYVQSPRSFVIGVGAASQILLLLTWRPVVSPWLVARRARKEFADPRFRHMLEHVRIGIDPEGLTEASPVSLSRTTWAGVYKIEVGLDRTLVKQGGSVYILPRRAFPDDDAYADYIEKMLEYHRAARRPEAA